MSVIDDLTNLERAIKWQESIYLPALIGNAREKIEKLEHDVKVLRWALSRAREVLLQGNEHLGVVDLLDTAYSMTEPANDR